MDETRRRHGASMVSRGAITVASLSLGAPGISSNNDRPWNFTVMPTTLSDTSDLNGVQATFFL